MSEQEKKEVKTEEKNDKFDLLDTNVSLVLAENTSLKALVAQKDEVITDLTKKLQQATDLIEEGTKSLIITEIKEKTIIPDKLLRGKSVEDLVKMKEVLNTAVIPAFRSGTPVYTDKKENPATKLDRMYEEYAKQTWRKDKQ